jgi:invasion protein IalB
LPLEARIEQDFPVGTGVLTPSLDLDATRLRQRGLTEEGGGLGRATLDARADTHVSVTPTVEARQIFAAAGEVPGAARIGVTYLATGGRAVSGRLAAAPPPAPVPAAPKAGALPPASSFEVISSGWTSACAKATRPVEPVRTLELRVRFRGDGGQNLRVTTPTGGGAEGPPGMLLRVPSGLFDPAGIRLGIDGAEVARPDVQTRDAAGRYAGTPLDAELAAALREGTRATVTFQDLARNDVGVPSVLSGFDPAPDGTF